MGRDFDEIGRTAHFLVTVVPDDAAFEPTMRRVAEQAGRSYEKYVNSSQVVAGTPDQVVEQIAPYIEAGAMHMTAFFYDSIWGDSIDRFAEEVIPQLR